MLGARRGRVGFGISPKDDSESSVNEVDPLRMLLRAPRSIRTIPSELIHGADKHHRLWLGGCPGPYNPAKIQFPSKSTGREDEGHMDQSAKVGFTRIARISPL